MKIRKKKVAVSVGPRVDNETWDLHKHGVTQSILSEFLNCPERFRLGVVERLRTNYPSDALAFGNIVHEALDRVYTEWMHKTVRSNHETWWKDCLSGSLQKMEDRDRKRFHKGTKGDYGSETAIETLYGMAEVILPAYFDQWSSDFQDVEWVALEEVFDVPYSPSQRLGMNGVPDVPVRGKRDGVFKVRKGLWLLETKTKGRIEEESILDRLSYDLQVCLYSWAMKQKYGRWPKGVLYNLIRRPQLRQKSGEGLKDFISRIREDVVLRPDFYFIRYNCVLVRSELESWEREFDGMMSTLIGWCEGQFHYKNSSACHGRAGICPFIKLCGHNDPTDLAKRDLIFPELHMSG